MPRPAPAAAVTARATPRPAVAVSPPALRPRTVVELLDDAWEVLKRYPNLVYSLAAVFIVPSVLFSAVAQRGSLATVTTLDPALWDSQANGSGSFWGFFGAFVISSITTVAIGAALAPAVVAFRLGGTVPRPGQALRAMAARGGPLFGSWLLVHLAEAPLLLTGVLWLIPAAMWVVSAPVVMLERVGAAEALRRSRDLNRGRFATALGFYLASGLIATVLSAMTSVVPLALFGGSWVAVSIVAVITSLVTMPFVAIATTLFYLDLRIRSEGFDIELAAAEAFGDRR